MIITKIIPRKDLKKYLDILKDKGAGEASRYEIMDPDEQAVLLQFRFEENNRFRLLGFRDVGRLTHLIV